MPDHAPLPDTVAELHALVLEQQASMAKMRQEIAERDREIVERDQELERLKAQIDKLRRMHFGRKSEQLVRQIDRLETQLEDVAAGSGVADVRRARARAASSGASATSSKEALAALVQMVSANRLELSEQNELMTRDEQAEESGGVVRWTPF
jgi:transposase